MGQFRTRPRPEKTGDEMMKRYKIIYADPAWVYQDKSKSHGGGAESHYQCTSTDEMGKIDTMADDNSVCLMWVTYPQLEEGLKLMKLWGFRFKTVAFTWAKLNKKSSGFFFGMGRYTRSNPEIVLLGIKGKGIKRESASIPNLQIYPRSKHSKKPTEIRKQIVKLFGDLPRIELFARERTEGWDAWGNELAPAQKKETTVLSSVNSGKARNIPCDTHGMEQRTLRGSKPLSSTETVRG